MAAWSGGYFTDVQYTSNFYPQLAPGSMAFACLRQGVRPPALGAGSTFLELGCGQGFGLNLLAAANPGLQFLGVDFHPGQIANATQLAQAAGLANVAFEDLSFEQMLALPEGRLPRCEIIALHGVYSWVSPENRGVIVRILDRLLKPGGMAYVSYNCMPGWAPLIPLRRFLLEYVARTPGDPQVVVLEALRAALQMIEDGGRFFETAPTIKPAIERALKQDPSYLVHEHLNAHFNPLFHADVAREMEGARLSFAASANVADDLPSLAAPAPLERRISATQDGTWKQTLLDYAGAKLFRRDIFVRGLNRLSGPERAARLAETRFALLTSPDQLITEFIIPIGRMKGDPKVYGAIAHALAGGPKSYAELAGLPALAGAAEGVLIKAVSLLVGAHQIHPLAEDAATEPALAFNRAVLARLDHDPSTGHLASALTGAGVRLEFPELLAVRGELEGETNTAMTARHGAEALARAGVRLAKDGQPLAEGPAVAAELKARIAAFRKAKLPLYRQLGVV
ncbi:MAG: hypothetical protein JWP49_1469 [Phenylobacterium sp.]|nr:hypothetical protein [Phenylobacterium sp.]